MYCVMAKADRGHSKLKSVVHVLSAKAATAFSASYPLQFCPSVPLSHVWISQKRCKLELPNFYHRLPGRLQFQES